MRSLRLVVAAFALLAGAASCSGGGTPGPSTGTNGFATFVDRSDGFSIRYPTDWTKTLGGQSTVVSFRSPAGGTGRGVVSVGVQGLGQLDLSLDAYTQAVIAQLGKSIDAFHLVSSEPASLAAKPAARLTYTGTVNGVPLRWQQVLAIIDGQVWFVTFSATEQGFDPLLPTAQAMVDSFALT